jgi:hypothetical protein
MAIKSDRQRYFVCIANDGCDDLRIRQVYRVMSDPHSEKAGLLRVIDESGEDYLYPKGYFARITIPPTSRPTIQKMFYMGRSRSTQRRKARTKLAGA